MRKLKFSNKEKTLIDCMIDHKLYGLIPHTMDKTHADFNKITAGEFGAVAEYIEPDVKQEAKQDDVPSKPSCSCATELAALKIRVEALEKQGVTTQSPSKPAKAIVNVNTATWEQLEPLPLIGATGAKTIVAKRDKGGKFKNHADFKDRTGYDFTPDNLKGLITF